MAGDSTVEGGVVDEACSAVAGGSTDSAEGAIASAG